MTTTPAYGDLIKTRSNVGPQHLNLVVAQREADALNDLAFEGQTYEVESTGTQWQVVLIQEERKVLAEVGDWVVLAGGEQGTVVKSNLAVRGEQYGTYYHVLVKGGFERYYTHWDGDAFLTVDSAFGKDTTTTPLFIVAGA